MYLWVDDERNPPVPSWAHAKTWGEATIYLAHMDNVHTVSLDHDLGPDSPNGYQIVKWMIEHGRLPGRIILHTANPVGRNNMREALQKVGYKIAQPVNIGACQSCPVLIHSDV